MKSCFAGRANFNFVLYFVITCIVFLNPVSLLAFSERTGSLESYLKSFSYGVKADNQWQEPDREKMALFDIVIDNFIRCDFEEVRRIAPDVGYTLIRFTDTDQPAEKVHYILTEKNRIGEPGFQGGGIYVVYPEGYNVAIEAPHPKTDLYTEKEAIEVYLSASSRYLLIAGTRRDSSTEYSECSGGYPKSDAVHHTRSFFQVAHERLNILNPDTVFINLHGFGSKSLALLQKQCGTINSNLINISEGVYSSPPLTGDNFTFHLAQQIGQDGLAAVCIYGVDTKSLGGTFATNGRITNGSSDSCFERAPIASHRYIHLEQSYKLRSTYRANIVQSITTAIKTYRQSR